MYKWKKFRQNLRVESGRLTYVQGHKYIYIYTSDNRPIGKFFKQSDER